MASNSYLTIEEVVTSAFLALDIQDSRDEWVFQEWAWDALRTLGPSRVDKKTACIDVCDLIIEKPCGYISALNLNILDANGKPFYYQFSETGVLNSDGTSLSSTISLTDGVYDEHRNFFHIKIEEGKNCFYLSSNADNAGITKAELSYYAFPINEDGKMEINEEFKNAIVAYIEFMYTKRQRKRSKREVAISEIQYLEDRWMRLCISAKGNMRMPDPMAARSITARWMTLIPNFKKNSRDFRTNIRL